MQDGDIYDPYSEFFIQENINVISNDLIWNKK